VKRYHQACLIWGPGNSTTKTRGMLAPRLGLSSGWEITTSRCLHASTGAVVLPIVLSAGLLVFGMGMTCLGERSSRVNDVG
jgi:hypothetical protein